MYSTAATAATAAAAAAATTATAGSEGSDGSRNKSLIPLTYSCSKIQAEFATNAINEGGIN